MKSKVPDIDVVKWLQKLSIEVYQVRETDPSWMGWEAEQALIWAAKKWEELVKEVEGGSSPKN